MAARTRPARRLRTQALSGRIDLHLDDADAGPLARRLPSLWAMPSDAESTHSEVARVMMPPDDPWGGR